jgi:energy-coupling factor transporter ATP-binding protein EcfA2/SAM-dependent methyltransferase
MALITKFHVPANELDDVGLQEISMSRLGRFVVLAGKNGSGKSRLLTKLEWYVSARVNVYANLKNLNIQITNVEHAIKTNPEHELVGNWKRDLDSLKQQLSLAFNRVVSNEAAGKLKAVRFVPKQLNLKDPRQTPSSQLTAGFAQAKVPGIANVEQNSLFYVKQLQERWWNATHPQFSGEDNEKNAATSDYEGFKTTLYKLLREHLGRNVDGEPTLFGRPIFDANLSDGQKVILQLCVALHAQKTDFDNTVFILDEPENHLHPSAVIDLLEALYQAADKSQIWIATHSIPLLAYVASIEPMALWFIEDGLAKNSGRAPQKVLEGLLGSDERIGQLNAFTGLPAQLACLQYACESLLAPQVVSDGVHDPQVSQIQKILSGLNAGASVRVLDYGAGKGRLLEGLAECFVSGNQKLSELIDYFAFDPFSVDRAQCEQVIQSYFPDDASRYFGTPDDFFSKKDDQSIDVVVMCNVLHEISPRDWTTLFSNDSLIGRSLKEKGFLLIVEDQRIPVGEKAHDHGFIVLDTQHLRTLFGVTEADIRDGQFVVDDRRKDGRLKAHLIAQSLLKRLTADSRKKAVEQLRSTAKDQIANLRKMDATYANGQLNGFWTQQFANASLYLEEA